jgi:hypothetical protein
MTKVKTLKLAGLLSVEDKDDFIFTIKCTTAMIFSRNLGKKARKKK